MTSPRPTSAIRCRGLHLTARMVGAVAAVALMLVVSPLPAGAHAVLESTSPFDGERVEQAPNVVTLTFNEDVHASTGAVRVFDDRGRRVDAGTVAVDGPTITVPVDSSAPGTYVVTWRALSADSHPVRGAFVYSVAADESVDEGLVARLFDTGGDTALDVAAGVLRWTLYASGLTAAGLALFLALVHDGHEQERRRILRLTGGAAAVGAVATVVAVPVQGARLSGLGAWGALTSSAVMDDTLSSGFGWSAGLRLAGLAVLVVVATGALRRRSLARVTLAVGGAVTAGSWAVDGHSVVSTPRWLTQPADAVHGLAAAAWLGGLIGVAMVLRNRDREPVGVATIVARFSRLATVTVAALAVAGTALAWSEVRALRALTSTRYGTTLIVKLALVAVIVVVAAYNNRRLVPAVAGRATIDPATARGRLRRTVRLEAVGLVAVLAVTAVLVNQVPARTEAGVTGIFSVFEPLGDDATVNLVVDPNRVGVNQLHLYLLDATGRPSADWQAMELSLTQPSRDIGPIERTPDVAGPGHWILTGPELSIGGEWVIEVIGRPTEFTEVRTQITVFVNP